MCVPFDHSRPCFLPCPGASEHHRRIPAITAIPPGSVLGCEADFFATDFGFGWLLTELYWSVALAWYVTHGRNPVNRSLTAMGRHRCGRWLAWLATAPVAVAVLKERAIRLSHVAGGSC